MINTIKQYITDQNLFPSNLEKVFVAVSGGIDSCVLLDILNNLKSDFGVSLEIIHVNHNTRGKDNLEDESFVDKLSKNYGIPLQIKRLNKQIENKSEVYLREQRYKIFNTILAKSGNTVLATAHNADDNVETFLMRLFKGSHLKGLTAIQSKRDRYVRPLLSQSRASIEKYALKNHIQYREDYTNKDNRIFRNFIRNETLPLVKKHTRVDVNQNILKTIEELTQHYQLFKKLLQQSIIESIKKTKYGLVLNKNKYKSYDSIIQKGLIEYCISSVQPLNYGLSLKNFQLWDEFIKNSSPGKKKNILSAGYAISERKEIVFGDFPAEKNESYLLPLNSEIVIEKKYKIAFNEVEQNQITFNRNKNIEFIDGDKSGNGLVVRFWKKGDSFRPLGMKQRRKLSDFFIDLKLSTRLKKEIPIICKKDEIIWIAGYRLDDHFKISSGTNKFYKISITKETVND